MAVVAEEETRRRALTIEGMTCGSCAARIQRGLSKVPGVVEADANDATGTATVQHLLETPQDGLLERLRGQQLAAAPQRLLSSPHRRRRGGLSDRMQGNTSTTKEKEV